jgi:hypothetical protein
MDTIRLLDSLEERFRSGEVVPVVRGYISLVTNAMRERGCPIREYSQDARRVFFLSEEEIEKRGKSIPDKAKVPVKKKRKYTKRGK